MIAQLIMSRILQKKYARGEFFLRQSDFYYKIQHNYTKTQAFMTILYHFKYTLFISVSESQFCRFGAGCSTGEAESTGVNCR